MKHFLCDHCHQPVYFENTQCLACGHALGFLPELGCISALEPADGQVKPLWTALAPGAADAYRPCQNQLDAQACNWLVAADDPNPLCLSCRLNQTIPDLTQAENLAHWSKIELAKRRLLYTLFNLGLPVVGKQDDPEQGLAFAFLAAEPGREEPVVTGHANGLITIDVAEADDAFRERQRLNMDERYRTLLGHLRHECGHYYWQRLVAGGPADQLEMFRALFGDERDDYNQALNRHYQNGPPVDWQQRYISAYASAHPWEDWAETWAHYLHIVDTLETARAVGLNVQAAPGGVAPAPGWGTTANGQPSAFTQLMRSWPVLTFAINSINRSMGLNDLYPFVITAAVIEKLHFVHDLIRRSG